MLLDRMTSIDGDGKVTQDGVIDEGVTLILLRKK